MNDYSNNLDNFLVNKKNIIDEDLLKSISFLPDFFLLKDIPVEFRQFFLNYSQDINDLYIELKDLPANKNILKENKLLFIKNFKIDEIINFLPWAKSIKESFIYLDEITKSNKEILEPIIKILNYLEGFNLQQQEIIKDLEGFNLQQQEIIKDLEGFNLQQKETIKEIINKILKEEEVKIPDEYKKIFNGIIEKKLIVPENLYINFKALPENLKEIMNNLIKNPDPVVLVLDIPEESRDLFKDFFLIKKEKNKLFSIKINSSFFFFGIYEYIANFFQNKDYKFLKYIFLILIIIYEIYDFIKKDESITFSFITIFQPKVMSYFIYERLFSFSSFNFEDDISYYIGNFFLLYVNILMFKFYKTKGFYYFLGFYVGNKIFFLIMKIPLYLIAKFLNFIFKTVPKQKNNNIDIDYETIFKQYFPNGCNYIEIIFFLWHIEEKPEFEFFTENNKIDGLIDRIFKIISFIRQENSPFFLFILEKKIKQNFGLNFFIILIRQPLGSLVSLFGLYNILRML